MEKKVILLDLVTGDYFLGYSPEPTWGALTLGVKKFDTEKEAEDEIESLIYEYGIGHAVIELKTVYIS